jgi:hypothetical protein
MAQDSASMSITGASQGPPTPNPKNPVANIYMVKVKVHLSTRTPDYEMTEFVEKGKEASNPLNPLQIENTVEETMTHIPNGDFKKDSHNPNMRAYQNYSIMEDVV